MPSMNKSWKWHSWTPCHFKRGLRGSTSILKQFCWSIMTDVNNSTPLSQKLTFVNLQTPGHNFALHLSNARVLGSIVWQPKTFQIGHVWLGVPWQFGARKISLENSWSWPRTRHYSHFFLNNAHWTEGNLQLDQFHWCIWSPRWAKRQSFFQCHVGMSY